MFSSAPSESQQSSHLCLSLTQSIATSGQFLFHKDSQTPDHGHRFVASDYHCFPNSTFSQNFKCMKAVTDLQTNGLSLTGVTIGTEEGNHL